MVFDQALLDAGIVTVPDALARAALLVEEATRRRAIAWIQRLR